MGIVAIIAMLPSAGSPHLIFEKGQACCQRATDREDNSDTFKSFDSDAR